MPTKRNGRSAKLSADEIRLASAALCQDDSVDLEVRVQKGSEGARPFLRLTKLFFFVTFGLISSSGSTFATPISDKYSQLGANARFLGPATTPESTNRDGIGKHRHYQNGSIYWHPETGAREVHGLIHQKWEELGWEESYLGYPMTDEIDTFNGAGKVSKFQGGELIWRSATNKVSEVRSTDLIVDLPFPAGEAWQIIQANAVAPNDSHIGPWAYCWDFILAGKHQSQSNGRAFTASANTQIVYVEQDNDSGGKSSNVIVQRLGDGRYASYLHIKKGSYAKHFAGGSEINLRPQDAPWARRPTPKTGMVLAEVGDTGAAVGAYHLHFCVTTKPDRDQFRPFESVPVAFRNYSFSTDSGRTWKYVKIGVPKRDQWMRADSHSGESGPQVNASAAVLDYGTVKGQIFFPSTDGKQVGPGNLIITVLSSWGEPLNRVKLGVSTDELNSSRGYEINNVPAFRDLFVGVSYSASWSTGKRGELIRGRSGIFELKSNTTATQDLRLQTGPGS